MLCACFFSSVVFFPLCVRCLGPFANGRKNMCLRILVRYQYVLVVLVRIVRVHTAMHSCGSRVIAV